jgi:hypothetical protein
MTLATDDTRLPSLFAHTTRKDWGIGVLAWETGGKRGYLFEDGEERTMANGFHDRMRKVEQPSADQKAASIRLQRMLLARARSQSVIPGACGPTFSDQLANFREIYPEGLKDEKWVQEVRGEGVEQRLAQHRSALVKEAEVELSAVVIDSLLATQQYEQLWDLVLSVLGHTDLVPSAQLRKPKSPNHERQRDLANTTRELLYGKAPYEQRFDRFVAALGAYLGEAARWEIATALSAVVHPADHVCIHPTAFRLQLKAAGSRESAATRPSSAAYKRLLAVARIVAKKLTDQRDPPRDLLDVYDFIRITMKPAPKARTSAKSSARSSVRAAAADDDQDETIELDSQED